MQTENTYTENSLVLELINVNTIHAILILTSMPASQKFGKKFTLRPSYTNGGLIPKGSSIIP